MLASRHANIAAKLSDLVSQIQSLNPHRERKPRGRPNRGIRGKFVRLDIYLSSEAIDAIDAIAASRVTRTGHPAPSRDREAQARHVLRQNEEGRWVRSSRRHYATNNKASSLNRIG